MLFLDVASHMMLARDWEYRAVTVTMESHTRKGRFALYGANHPSTIDAVDERRIDISILNPAAMLTMAYRGVGAFDRVRQVATIAVLPHIDRLGFAVADRLGFTRLQDIAKARYPLRVSTRGSTDACTPVMVDVVLRAHGFRWHTSSAGVVKSSTTSLCRTTRPASAAWNGVRSTLSLTKASLCGPTL